MYMAQHHKLSELSRQPHWQDEISESSPSSKLAQLLSRPNSIASTASSQRALVKAAAHSALYMFQAVTAVPGAGTLDHRASKLANT